MKQENGKGMIKALILLVIIICVIVVIIKSISSNISEQKNNNLMANMLTIKSTCKVYNENRLRTKSEEAIIGTKISDINVKEENKEQAEDKQNEEENKDEDKKIDINESVIEEFKNLQVISEEEYSKYYVLTNENLQELNIEVTNEKDSYYLINYETNEVIFTKGYEGKYKLSDIEKLQEEDKATKENKEDGETEEAQENKESGEEENIEEKTE